MTDTDRLMKRSTRYILEGLFDPAIETLTKMIAAGSDTSDVYIARSLAYSEKVRARFPNAQLTDNAALDRCKAEFRESADIRKALADIDNALRLDAACAEGYLGKGAIMFNRGDYPAAINAFDKYLELVPGDAAVYCQRASAHTETGAYQNAISDLTKALELAPETDHAYYQRATIYMELQEYSKALSDIIRAIELAPAAAYYTAQAKLILLMFPEGDNRALLKKAVLDLTTAIKLAPANAEAYYLRAQAELLLGERQKELADLTKVITLAPREADIYKQRFASNLACGRKEAAATDWLVSCQLDGRSTSEAIMVLKNTALENLKTAGYN